MIMVFLLMLVLSPSSYADTNDRIVFVSSRDGNDEIYIMNADGSNQINLTNSRWEDTDPAGSPDGTRIAFTSGRPSTAALGLFVMNADGSQVKEVSQGGDTYFNPAWSPDGTKLIYIKKAWEDEGPSGTFLLDIESAAETLLSEFLHVDHKPVFSPNGMKIAFNSQRDGLLGLWVMDVGGTNAVNLTPGVFAGGASWSPDGSRIVFAREEEDGNIDTYVMNADGSNKINITNHPSFDVSAVWSPTGDKIVFVSTRGGASQLYLMNPDGTDLVQLTNSNSRNERPSWLLEQVATLVQDRSWAGIKMLRYFIPE
jgi:Tol biopolymer transport system component